MPDDVLVTVAGGSAPQAPTGQELRSLLSSPTMKRLVASWFGTGLIVGRLRGSHVGAGTVGALFTFPLAVGVGAMFGLWGQATLLVTVMAAGLWSTRSLVDMEGDAGWIVVDEAAGMCLALLGLTLSPAAVMAFLVFRAADIFKNYFPGVDAAEQHLPGAWGVLADDLVAGLYGLVAGLITRAVM